MVDRNTAVNLGILLLDTPGSTFELASLGEFGQQVEDAGFYRVGGRKCLICSNLITIVNSSGPANTRPRASFQLAVFS